MGAPKGNNNKNKNKPWVDSLRRALVRRKDGKVGALNAIADQVVALAINGEPWAVKEISERLDGKVAQTTVLQGDEENPLVFKEVRRTIVDPK